MTTPDITPSLRASFVLRRLRERAPELDRRLPRLTQRGFTKLTVEEPRNDDVIVKKGDVPLAAVSRTALDGVSERERLETTQSDSGEVLFRLVSAPMRKR